MSILSHRIRLYPCNKHKTLCSKSAGVGRFSYNWALDEWNKQYENGEKPNEASLRKQLNSIKDKEFPWMYEVSKCCPQQSIRNLGTAFDRFFKGVSERPKFKKKGVHDSFYLDNLNFKIKGKQIYLAKIGWIRMSEEFRYEDAKLLSATISREADQWYVSISCEVQDSPKQPLLPFDDFAVGEDVGVRCYADSNGDISEVPRSYRTYEKRLKRAQRSLSRKYESAKNAGKQLKDCKNYQKQKQKVAKLHQRISNVRKDWLHKLTTDIVKNNQTIIIEDLNVKGMIKNRRLAKSIQDASFGEFRRQLEYKSVLCGRTLILANRWYPSSKLCSSCHVKTKQKLGLHVRRWTCEHCGAEHDRDVNAAVNLKLDGLHYLASLRSGSSSESACGEFLSLVLFGKLNNTKTPRNPRKRKKQEENGISQCVSTLCRNA